MILYFSATGNCKYVAARLASAFGQETVSIVDCMHDGVYAFTDDTIAIVVPTYFWGLPSIVKEFLEKADFHTDYLYFISTYGTTPSRSTHFIPCGCQTLGRRSLTCPRLKRWQRFLKRRKQRLTRQSARLANVIPTGIWHRTFLHFWRSGSHNRVTTTINGERRIFVWRKAASAADCARKNVPFRLSRCRRRSQYGSKRSAPCALAACTAAPSLPFSMGRTPNGTASIRIRM